MADQELQVKIISRHDTAANWTSYNPTLAAGELGIETDTHKIKIGDGSTAWTSLDYATGSTSGETTTVDFATLTEVNTGTETAKAISPATLAKGQASGVAVLDSSSLIPLNNLPSASTSSKGIMQFATDAEVTTGTEIAKAISPKQLTDSLNNLPSSSSPHGIAVFTSSGSWTCPSSVTTVYASMCGGGGGGGGASGTTSYRGAGGGGGGGQAYFKYAVTVEPNTTYTITIGAGGTAGGAPGNGGDGGNTSFGSLLVAAGGKGGEKATNSSTYNGTGGAAGGTGGNAGGNGQYANGEAYYSGAGGGCLLGTGACGNTCVTSTGNDCGCYGGGGSGAMSGTVTSGTAGGAGGQGICIIEW